MALRDWVRHEGNIESTPSPSPHTYGNDETFIMLVRDIQFQDVQSGAYNRFPTLYDVASANAGRNYIPVTDNTKLIQDPPNPALINSFRKNNS
jgi:hypothetical protein